MYTSPSITVQDIIKEQQKGSWKIAYLALRSVFRSLPANN